MPTEVRVDVRAPAVDPAVQHPPRARLEWVGWLATGVALAVLLTWPLVRHLGTRIPQDTGDPLAQAWFLAWGGHALTTSPTSLFQGNVSWPAERSFAFADSLLGYAPFALVGDGPVAAVVRYDLVLLTAYALAFAAAGLLARELGCRVPAATVTAAAYAWAPWKVTHNGHLNVLSTGSVALTLFLLVSGYRRGRPWQVVAGWAVAAWQLSLGFALGIWFAYLLAVLAAVAVAAWLRRGRPALPGPLLRATVAGTVLLGAVTAFMVRPYLQIAAASPDALRSRDEVALFSPPVRGLLAAGQESRAWGEATAFVRDTLVWPPEQALLPGVVVVLLAVAGLRWSRVSPTLRLWLLAGVVVTGLLSLGVSLWGGLLYDPLLSYAPGWDGLRTPGRLAFLWTLGLAVLAGFGAQRALDALAGRALPAALGAALGLLLTATVLYEGAPRLPLVDVPTAPAALSGLEGPLLHLPAGAGRDTTYMLWSTDGFPLIVNGDGAFRAPEVDRLQEASKAFPDAASVRVLRDAGVRTVVVHRATVSGTPWEGAADRSVDDLDVTRRDAGDVVVFELSQEP